MDIEKYRKWYLLFNWGNSAFKSVKYKPVYKKCNDKLIYRKYIHPKIRNESAYWINMYELCIGYVLKNNNNIFRPVFSYKRQKILDKINADIKKPNIFWDKIKSRYFNIMAHKKELPLYIIEYIVGYMYI